MPRKKAQKKGLFVGETVVAENEDGSIVVTSMGRKLLMADGEVSEVLTGPEEAPPEPEATPEDEPEEAEEAPEEAKEEAVAPV